MKNNIKKKVCIFCGSSFGKDKSYFKITKEIGNLIGTLNYDLVYGGGHVGLMGLVANAARKSGSKINGVIPKFLQKREIPMQNIDLTITKTMRVRKAKMYKMSSLFLILNGGIGTLDELVEVLTLIQLKQIQNKPVLILNVKGFWNPVFKMFHKMIDEGFLNQITLNNFLIIKNTEEFKIFLKSFK